LNEILKELPMPRVSSNIRMMIAEMPPAYFAMVMATGIVSIACHLLGFEFIAAPLLWLNVCFYVALWALTIVRVGLYPKRFLSDFRSHRVAPGFFTMVAGTCILGSQFVILRHAFHEGIILWVAGFALWGLLVYGVFSALAVKMNKPLFTESIDGIWLVTTVSTQSVSVLAALLEPHFPWYDGVLLFIALCMFLIGGMLYLIIITLIFYRLLFLELKPEAFAPTYWINMGAVAITTLAGSTLVESGESYPFLQTVKPFVIGFTVFFWAAATWWIPFLIVLGVWRYLVKRVEFAYTPQYWSVVFPLGMYTTCTAHLSGVLGLDWLMAIPRFFIYCALIAWALTFIGLIKSLAGSLSGFHQKIQ
jgi:tellurite resistance protein TehA-like permease